MGFFCKRKMDTRHIKEILTEDIKSLGCDIWGIEFFGKYKNQTLRIYIDNKEGISVEDCEKVSKHVIKLLDVENDFSNKYFLEVSSPGLERKFFSKDQYQSYIDCSIKVRYINDLNKKISIKGMLSGVTAEGLTIESRDKDHKVPFSSIIQANLIM
jgi:ribosome maturation factor RimP|tara:strand:- start:878 stop:1345 length:468 start_codon:yes stop_codon:yes gene_type:complete